MGPARHEETKADCRICPEAARALLQATTEGSMLAAVYDQNDRLVYANEAFMQAFALAEIPEPLTFASIVLHNAINRCGALIEHNDPLTFIRDAQSRRRVSPGQRAFLTDMHDGRWFQMVETFHETGWITLLGIVHTAQKSIERQLESERWQASLEANTDALTGLPNRRQVLGLLETALDQASESLPFTIAMADIDHFKAINDTGGHAAGDATLVDFATLARMDIRPHDIVGRMGGEEFLFIFPGLQEEAAAATLSRLIDLVGTRAGADLRVSVPFSFSCGLHRVRSGEDCASALKQADDALYRAKRAGRGRVESSAQAAQEQHLTVAPGSGSGSLVGLAGDSSHPAAVLTAADYHVKFGKRLTSLGWLGTLKVRRLTDGKIIYPFDGCTDIGPFRTPEEAREAARLLAEDLARQDTENPEP